MSIRTECPSCGRGHTLADAQAGEKVRCKDCGKGFFVPDADDEFEDSTRRRTRRRDESAHERPARRRKQSNGLLLFGLIGGGVFLLVLISAPLVWLALAKSNRGSSRVSVENLEKARQLKTEDEVLKLLGKPTSVMPLGPVRLCKWEEGGNSITITFENGKVQSVASSFGEDTATKGTPFVGLGTPGSAEKITRANYDRIQLGMSSDQVQAILGKANNIIQEQSALGDECWLYMAGIVTVEIYFKDARVSHKKNSNLLQ
jgi:hypothetical protein